MFDDLLDPDPPRPGLREYAIVTNRTRDLRRQRRARIAPFAALAVVIAAATLTAQLARPANERIRTAHDPGGAPSGQSLPESAGPTPADDEPAFTRGEPLDGFDSSGIGSPLVLPSSTIRVDVRAGNWTIPLSLVARGSEFCVGVSDLEPACARPDASLHWLTVDTPDESTALVVFAHADVRVAFELVDRSCAEFASAPDVQGWVCDGVASSTTEVRLIGPDRLLIDTVPPDP